MWRWVAYSFVGFCVGFVISALKFTHFPPYHHAFFVGGGVAIAQWLILRRFGVNLIWCASYPAALIIGDLLIQVLAPSFASVLVGPFYLETIVQGALVGLIAGGVQILSLPQQLRPTSFISLWLLGVTLVFLSSFLIDGSIPVQIRDQDRLLALLLIWLYKSVLIGALFFRLRSPAPLRKYSNEKSHH